MALDTSDVSSYPWQRNIFLCKNQMVKEYRVLSSIHPHTKWKCLAIWFKGFPISFRGLRINIVSPFT